MMRSITAQWNFSIARNRSSSIRNSFSSRRIVGTGSDASGNCGAGVMRLKETNINSGGLIWHLQIVPKYGLQTVKAPRLI